MKIEWSALARQDLTDLHDHFVAIDPDVARRMLERVEQAPALLSLFPKLGARTNVSGWRKWKVRGTPYLLFYSKTDRGLMVARVLHVARDPFW